MNPSATPRLTRAGVGAGTPPERIVHLGLGAFHRAHQAWYTSRARDAADWGIVAFTGRSRDLVDRLAPQDGLYTLIERGAEKDSFRVIPSVVRVEAGDDVPAFVEAVSAPHTAILTLTITEAGYRLGPDQRIDLADPVVASDLASLRATRAVGDLRHRVVTEARFHPVTAPGRILLALEVRRRVGSGPIAVVSCDNLPGNGRILRQALLDLASQVSTELGVWFEREVCVVSTSIDRITPSIDIDVETASVAEATGWHDSAPVVTEPFSDWILEGEFPAGRPDWASAGARFVDHLDPWERRKLWMLNGAHTVLAALGQARGHSTVDAAIGDPICRAVVEELWDDDARQLPGLDLGGYRAALVDRFGNPRIAHRLSQIAQDSTTKMRLRVVPVAVAELEAGRAAGGCAAAVAAWLVGVRAGHLTAPGTSDEIDPTLLLAALDARLTESADFLARVKSHVTALEDDIARLSHHPLSRSTA